MRVLRGSDLGLDPAEKTTITGLAYISSGTCTGGDVVDGDEPSSTIDEAPENSSCSSQVKRRGRLFYQMNLMSTIKQ
jgi:hypothetical protein